MCCYLCFLGAHAPSVGFEPTTVRLTAESSAVELQGNIMAPPAGLEPTTVRVETDLSIQLRYGGIFNCQTTFIDIAKLLCYE